MGVVLKYTYVVLIPAYAKCGLLETEDFLNDVIVVLISLRLKDDVLTELAQWRARLMLHLIEARQVTDVKIDVTEPFDQLLLVAVLQMTYRQRLGQNTLHSVAHSAVLFLEGLDLAVNFIGEGKLDPLLHELLAFIFEFSHFFDKILTTYYSFLIVSEEWLTTATVFEQFKSCLINLFNYFSDVLFTIARNENHMNAYLLILHEVCHLVDKLRVFALVDVNDKTVERAESLDRILILRTIQIQRYKLLIIFLSLVR